MGEALVGIALPEMRLGNHAEAARHLEEAMALFKREGDDNMALIPLGLLGVCARLEGSLAVARQRYVEILVRSHRAHAHVALTLALVALGDLALVEGDPERAAVLGAAEAKLAEGLGGTPSLRLVGIPDVLDRARNELGNDRYEEAVERGRSAPLDEIVRLALSEEATPRAK